MENDNECIWEICVCEVYLSAIIEIEGLSIQLMVLDM